MSSPATSTLTFKITVIVEEDNGGFYAWCPALKGLHVTGDSVQEALAAARTAIIAYLQSLQKHGDPIPAGPDLTVERADAFPDVPLRMIHEVTLQWPTPSVSGTS